MTKHRIGTHEEWHFSLLAILLWVALFAVFATAVAAT
jgi:hypothetical protein